MIRYPALSTLVLATCLIGCGCSVFPDREAPPPIAPLTVEYEIPLLRMDGSIEKLTVEDSKPEDGIKIVFCKELPTMLACLVDENGKQEWMAVPVAQAPAKPDKQT